MPAAIPKGQKEKRKNARRSTTLCFDAERQTAAIGIRPTGPKPRVSPRRTEGRSSTAPCGLETSPPSIVDFGCPQHKISSRNGTQSGGMSTLHIHARREPGPRRHDRTKTPNNAGSGKGVGQLSLGRKARVGRARRQVRGSRCRPAATLDHVHRPRRRRPDDREGRHPPRRRSPVIAVRRGPVRPPPSPPSTPPTTPTGPSLRRSGSTHRPRSPSVGAMTSRPPSRGRTT